jgi:hypothetical protein
VGAFQSPWSSPSLPRGRTVRMRPSATASRAEGLIVGRCFQRRQAHRPSARDAEHAAAGSPSEGSTHARSSSTGQGSGSRKASCTFRRPGRHPDTFRRPVKRPN